MKPMEMKERIPNETRCVIYTGVLGNGSLSKGFVPVDKAALHAVAWVCPMMAFDSRDRERQLETIRFKSDQEWAAINVRLINIEFGGTYFTPSAEDYDVIVPGEFKTAQYGRLVRKPGRSIDCSVPEGDTVASNIRNSLIDRSKTLSERLKIMNSAYVSNNQFTGPQQDLGSVKTPSPGHVWVGAK